MNAYETNERIICGATVEEKEVLNTSVAAAVGKSSKSKVEENNLKKYLNQNVGDEVKEEDIKASFKNGTLKIEVPKKEEKKDKTIQENKKDERIANQVKNAFGKGVSNDGSRGDSDEGSGTQGNPFGNSSTGEITGVGGYGGYNLGGRGLVGSLPYPEYDNSNDAGIIAISITVDPQGKVISAIATVNGSKGTAFSNPKLRASAEAAARKSLFERSTGSSNQTGVIIYIFKQN